jgi:hypothetical protein
LGLPVLADPFWGRLPWLQSNVAETQQAEKFSRPRRCVRVRNDSHDGFRPQALFGKVRFEGSVAIPNCEFDLLARPLNLMTF